MQRIEAGSHAGRNLQISQRSGDQGYVTINQQNDSLIAGIYISFTELLQAVADEAGGVVIACPLPEVTADRLDRLGVASNEHFRGVSGFSSAHSADEAEAYGLAYLAIAKHLRENPPIDEKQVAAGVRLLVELDLRPITDAAREMVKRGVIFPEES